VLANLGDDITASTAITDQKMLFNALLRMQPAAVQPSLPVFAQLKFYLPALGKLCGTCSLCIFGTTKGVEKGVMPHAVSYKQQVAATALL
jgi:hypothetical protein